MADIELVIKIPDEVKKAFDDAEDINFSYYDYNSIIGKAIRNGTPLPKGHGRLIDADELKNEYCESNCGQRRCDKGGCMWIDSVKIAPTIIEKDKNNGFTST